MQEIMVITSKEQSTPASTWTEYLCIHKAPDGRSCIDIRGYEVIGGSSEYEDDDGNLPKTIGGLEVIGTEDGYVIVDNLVPYSDGYPEYRFENFDPEEFDELFFPENREWCGLDTRAEIIGTLAKLSATVT